jgi:hypothetical protein
MLTSDDAVFEKRLAAAFMRAAEIDYGGIHSDDELEQIVQPSPRFERKMKSLLRNPRRYLRNYRKPTYLNALQTAASVVIALAVLLAAAMAVSPSVRAAVVGLVRSWFVDRTIYETQPSVIDSEFTFGYVPEGFTLMETISTENKMLHIYKNSDSVSISIAVSSGKQAVDNEHSDCYQTKIGGRIADVYESNDPLYPNIILVYMDTSDIIVSIISSFDINKLIKVAEYIN